MNVKPWTIHLGRHLLRMSSATLVLCSACLVSVGRAQTVVVRNNRWERFCPVVSLLVSPTMAAKIRSQALVEVPDRPGLPGGRVPVALDEETDPKHPVLAFVLPEVLSPGETRTLRFVAPDTTSSAPGVTSDLEVEETPHAIIVRNTYFELRHPRKGGGGFPGRVRFRLSGSEDSALFFLDRLYSRETRRQYIAKNDANSAARVLFRSPTRVVVEARTGYVGPGGYAPGNIRAVYRYVYSPFSPVVEVQCRVERDDDRLWNELHFLHLSREDYYYTRFIVGDPPEAIPMLLPGKKSRGRPGARWGVMATDEQAVGVGFDRGVTCWDAADEFVYYVRANTGSWKSRIVEFHGLLYFGPAHADLTWFSRLLGRDRNVRAILKEDGHAVPRESLKGGLELANDALRIVFAPADGGFDCLGIENRLDGRVVRFVYPWDGGPGLWRLELRTPEGALDPPNAPPDGQRIVVLTNRSKCHRRATHERLPDGRRELRLVWSGLDLPGEPRAVDVTVTVRAAPGIGPSTWRIETRVRSRRFGLWRVHFPTLSQVNHPGEGDALLPGGNWGLHLVRNNRSGCSPTYPSAACPMQFMAFLRDGAGLYLGAHDGLARTKQLHVSAQQDAEFATWAENMGVPGASVGAPFPVVIAAFRGDWWEAARIYRRWALTQVWTRKGPLVQRKDVNPRFKNLGLWFCLSGKPEDVRPILLEAAERLPFPIGVHWYNWHKIPFDNSYPEYFPTKPGFVQAVRDLTARGVIVMPYINGRLWDRDIPSFQETGVRGACKDPKGEPYTEVYGSGRRLAPMCPVTKIWQNKVHEIVRRLFRECGVNAIYLDQIGAAAPRLCFDRFHGHPLGGGAWWTSGYREILDRVRAEAVAVGAALTTENDAEPYMDNIDGFLIWNPRYDTDVPALTAVYSGYTTYFSTPEAANDDLNAFVAAQGRDILWGCQPGWNGAWMLDAEHKEALDFLIRMVRVRLAAKDFFVYGRLVGEVRPLNPLPSTTVVWNRRKPHPATLPAVLGTIWTSPRKTLGVFLLNITDRPQEITWRLDPGRWLPDVRSSHGWLVSRLTWKGDAPFALLPESGARRSDVLLPREPVAFVVKPAPTLDALMRSAAALEADAETPEPVQAVLFDRTMAGFGVRIVPEAQLLSCAYDEAAPLGLILTNSGRERCDVRVVWPDGANEERVLDPGAHVTLRRDWRIRAADERNWAVGFARAECTINGQRVARAWRIVVLLTRPLTVRMPLPMRVRAGEDFILPVEVRNTSRRPRTARIELRLPPGWKADPGSGWDVGTLSSGARRTFLVRCRVPERSTPDLGRIEARLVTPLESAEVRVLPARPRLVCRMFAKPPSIDGRLDEWRDTPAIVLGPGRSGSVKITNNYGGESDCAARIMTGWDATAFYFAAEVRDDRFHQDEDGRSIWRGDCIQLAFHKWPPNAKGGYDGSEVELGLTRTRRGPYVYRWMPDEGEVRDARLAVQRTQDGRTVYEAAVPWSALKLAAPAAGTRWTASFTVNDNDGGGFRGWLEWTPGVCGGKDSSAFGRIDFVTGP